MRFRLMVSLAALGAVAGLAIVTSAQAEPPFLARYTKHVEPGILRKHIGLAPRGMRWGLTNEQIARIYDKIFDKEFIPLYQRVQPGPRMQALDAELADQKALIRRSVVYFNDTPTGLDNSPLQGEYSYLNHESMSELTDPHGVVRHFFFFSDRLWKIYDTYHLHPGGPLGTNFNSAIQALTKSFGGPPKIVQADFSKHQNYEEGRWVGSGMIIRAVNRQSENVLGLVYENSAVQDSIASYRPNHMKNANAMDPDVLAVTRPNAPPAPPPTKSKPGHGRR
jgi:hypothetical protein